MSEPSKFDKKRLLVVLLPALALGAFYLIYTYGASDFEADGFSDSTASTNALVAPDVEREDISSKSQIYESELEKNSAKEEAIKKGSNFDDMMATSPKEEVDPFAQSKKELLDKYNNSIEEKEIDESEEEEVSVKPVVKKRVSNSGSGGSVALKSNKTLPQENLSTVISLEKPVNPNERTGFYTSFKKNDKNFKQPHDVTGFINGTVQFDHTIRNGQTVNIRILENCMIGGHEIPANTYCNGIATFGNERCNVSIAAIRVGESIYHVNVVVYDQDGNKGIYVPGGVNQEIGQDAANTGSELQTTISIPVVGGISTNAASKKINDQSIKIPKGYKLLLKEITSNSNY